MQNAADMARDRQFNMRVSADEWTRLEALAAHYGLNPPNAIRFLLKKEADALGIAAMAPTPKKGAKKK